MHSILNLIQDSIMASPEAYTMEGGDGPSSYAKNSSIQKRSLEASKDLISQAIVHNFDPKVGIHPPLTHLKLAIADLGCATGPNTFVAIDNIIRALELKLSSLQPATFEFQVFFNDHVANDFNTLFKSIPGPSKYYAAGVPGSFYGRLFPNSSLHVVHSSYSLQWLSKVPESVTDPNSDAWNGGGRVSWQGESKQVYDAYLAKYSEDMSSFFNARAEELVPGGLLMMCVTVRPAKGVLARLGLINDLMGHCLADMAKEGMVLEESLDSFSLPIYYPTMEELEGIIAQNGAFDIIKMVALDHFKEMNSEMLEMITSSFKAVFATIIGKHFGYHIVDDVFVRFRRKLEENFDYIKTVDWTDLLVLLKHKINTSD